jgi:exonuclease SbcC
MLDFLFKKRRSAATTSSASAELAASHAANDTRVQARQQAREQAMQQAAALQDEAAALTFIVQCEFADARLQAAQWLQGAAALAEALRAVRNSDRRVAKLLQTRLDDIQRGQRAQVQMQAVLEQTEALLRDPALTPDRAADADRAWRAAAATAGAGSPAQSAEPDTALAARFSELQEKLSQRLAQQTQLQRSLIDTRLQLQNMLDDLRQAPIQASIQSSTTGDIPDAVEPAEANLDPVAETLNRLQQKIAEERIAPEAPALPKQLLQDCDRLLEECRAAHGRRTAAAAARLQRAQQPVAPELSAEAAQNEGLAPSISPESDSADQADQANQPDQTHPLQPKPQKSPKPAPKARPVASPEQILQWQSLLTQLEEALEQGALQAASEAERGLRAFDARLLKPAAAETSRLNAAYAALHHLQGWARWGGNISREELLQAALGLPAQELPVPELVQKIGGLRARWKLLNASAGPSPQALWEQFDAACTAAYAPAAAQFELQDQERRQNRVLAEALIAEAEQFAQQFGAADGALAPAADADAETGQGQSQLEPEAGTQPDWKQLAQFDTRMRQAWQRLGPLGHKEHRLLERAFNSALKTVQKPLRERQKIEVAARRILIDEVAALTADDRQALDKLRRIQADWQQRAQSVPLARKDEQALWLTFRAACDAVFAQRKETASHQDAQRQGHLQDKEAVCAQLEACMEAPDAAFDTGIAQTALQQARAAWSQTGPAPRAAERAIEQRFRNAADALQRRLQTAQDQKAAAAIAAEAEQIDARMALCFALDNALAQGRLSTPDIADWRARWQAATALPRALEQILTQRFEATLAAIDEESDANTDYAAQLERQREQFDTVLLEAEVALGLDSPPQLARQRMQLQVALLQSSLKAGAATLSGRQHLQRLCAAPAIVDAATLARVGAVIRRAIVAP